LFIVTHVFDLYVTLDNEEVILLRKIKTRPYFTCLPRCSLTANLHKFWFSCSSHGQSVLS